MQKFLGWIPARRNSRGVPGKNKRVPGDKRLGASVLVQAYCRGRRDGTVLADSRCFPHRRSGCGLNFGAPLLQQFPAN